MERVQSSDVLIALIGPNWLTASDEDGRRLDDPDDLLRREITAALERGATVIPVLAGNAEMPKPAELPDDLKVIPTIHSFRLGLGREYRSERERLIAHLDRIRDRRPGRFARLSRFVRTRTQGGRRPHRDGGYSRAPPRVAVVRDRGGLASRGTRNDETRPHVGPWSCSADTAYPDAIDPELLIAHIPRCCATCRVLPIAASALRSVARSRRGRRRGARTARPQRRRSRRLPWSGSSAGTIFPVARADLPGMGVRPRRRTDASRLQTHLEGGWSAEGMCLLHELADETFVWTEQPEKILARRVDRGSRPC